MASWGVEALKKIGIWPMFSPDDLPRLNAVHTATDAVYKEADLLLLSALAVERRADFTDDPETLKKLAWVRTYLRGLLDAWLNVVEQAISVSDQREREQFEAVFAAAAAIPPTGSLLTVMDPTEWGRDEIQRRITAYPGREQLVGLLALNGIVRAIEAQIEILIPMAAKMITDPS